MQMFSKNTSKGKMTYNMTKQVWKNFKQYRLKVNILSKSFLAVHRSIYMFYVVILSLIKVNCESYDIVVVYNAKMTCLYYFHFLVTFKKYIFKYLQIIDIINF